MMKKQGDIGIERKASVVHHSVAPQNIDENNWYYEGKNGIELIHQVLADAGDYVQTDSIFIPWEKLTHSVRRHLGTYN
jgi:hypothetical protein